MVITSEGRLTMFKCTSADTFGVQNGNLTAKLKR